MGALAITVTQLTPLTLGATSAVIGTVSPDVAQTPVVIFVSKSVAVPTDATLMMTVHTGGTAVTAGASFWVVPSGKTFRIQAMNVIGLTSAVLSNANLAVLLGTAAASLSVTSTVGVAAVLPYAIQASTTPFSLGGFKNDVVGGTTIALGCMGGTSHTIVGAVIQGYLF